MSENEDSIGDSSQEQSEPEISSRVEEVKTHFQTITPANKRGQARYRCHRCGHEFECSGRIRLIHHVVGELPDGTTVRNVRSCSNPFIPLKNALLHFLRQEMNQKTAVEDSLQKKKRKLTDIAPSNCPTLYPTAFRPLPSKVNFDRNFYERLSPQQMLDILQFTNQLAPRAVAWALAFEQQLPTAKGFTFLSTTSSKKEVVDQQNESHRSGAVDSLP